MRLARTPFLLAALLASLLTGSTAHAQDADEKAEKARKPEKAAKGEKGQKARKGQTAQPAGNGQVTADDIVDRMIESFDMTLNDNGLMAMGRGRRQIQ